MHLRVIMLCEGYNNVKKKNNNNTGTCSWSLSALFFFFNFVFSSQTQSCGQCKRADAIMSGSCELALIFYSFMQIFLHLDHRFGELVLIHLHNHPTNFRVRHPERSQENGCREKYKRILIPRADLLIKKQQ